MDLPIGMKLVGALFLVASAVGFIIENPWVFIAGQVLLFAWLGAVLMGPPREQR